jgi:branched-chain amino acid transport system permease protein
MSASGILARDFRVDHFFNQEIQRLPVNQSPQGDPVPAGNQPTVMDTFVSSIFPGVVNGCVYALIGIGFILIRKTSGVFNLAQGQIVIFGSYILYFFAATLGVPLWGAVALALVVGMAMGVVIERGLMRPLYGQDLNAAILVTLSLSVLLETLLGIGWGTNFLVAPRMFPKDIAFSLGTATVSYDQAAIILFAIFIFSCVEFFFSRTRMGIAMMAVSEDPLCAQSLGVRVARLVSISWVIACAIGFLGGILITNISGISYSMAEIGIKAIAVAIIGGFESFSGLMLAGVLVGLGEAMAVAFVDPYIPGGSVREIFAYVIMLAVLMIRPHGLFGWKRIERV